MVDWMMNGLVSWLAEKVTDLLGGLLAFLASFIFVSPDVTVLPQVTSIASKGALVVNACFILAIIAVGVAAMVGDSVQMRYGIKELLPRLVVGFVLSAFAVPLTGVLIDVANALTVSLTGTSAPTTEAVTFVRARLASAMTDQSSALLMTIIGLLIVVLMFMLVGTWLVRIGVLVVLAGIAPVALACYATPTPSVRRSTLPPGNRGCCCRHRAARACSSPAAAGFRSAPSGRPPSTRSP